MEKQPVISAKNIGIGYPKTRNRKENLLYSDLSFTLYRGEMVCLLGANGAGKSTLLRTISASQSARKGEIFLNGKNINAYSEKELSRLLGLVLTDKTSTGGLLVKELVELGRYPYTGFFGQLTREDKRIVQKAMEDVGIEHKADSYIAELSDGERQKVMIAKALAQECPIVILDEPTAFLDIESRIEIINLLHNLSVNLGKTILLSTHDIDLALLLADRLWLLSRDEGLIDGVTEDIVLSGIMDNFFKSENIVFNRETGNFLPNRNSKRKVFINATGQQLYWTGNLLERNGFSITDNKKEALFSLNVTADNKISLEKEDSPLSYFENFKQLSDYLKDTKMN